MKPSWRCPALITRAMGRQRRSAITWIFVVRPPLDRPRASRSLPPMPCRDLRVPPGGHRRRERRARRPRAGAPGWPWSPPSSSTRCPRPRRNPPEADPGCLPRSRRLTSGNAAHGVPVVIAENPTDISLTCSDVRAWQGWCAGQWMRWAGPRMPPSSPGCSCRGWPARRVARGVSTSGPHRSRRDSLPSPGSCHPVRQACGVHRQCRNMAG
jgi:hypothetical protein